MIAARLGRAFGPGRMSRIGAMWTLDWRAADGSRRRQALSRDRRIAERMRIEIVHQRDLEAAGLGTQEGQNKPLAELRDAYLADLETRACPRHLVNVRAGIDRTLGALRAKRVRDLRPHNLIQYRAARLKEGLSRRSANLEVDRLRAMLTWAERVGLVAANPVKHLPRLPESEATKRYRRRAMTEEEIARFLAAAEDDDRRNAGQPRGWSRVRGARRLRAVGSRPPRVPQTPLWRAFLETGARYGEMTAVTWADVDLEGLSLTLRPETTKAGRQRVIPIRPGLAGEITSLRDVHRQVLGRDPGTRDPVFRTPEGAAWCEPTNNIMRIFDRLLEAAAIPRTDNQGFKLDIHSLRHTAASRYAARGVGLVHLQRLLGHTDPKLTSRVYTHLGLDELRTALEMGAERRRASQRGAI